MNKDNKIQDIKNQIKELDIVNLVEYLYYMRILHKQFDECGLPIYDSVKDFMHNLKTRQNMKAQEIINNYKNEGYSISEIKDFLQDGQALSSEGFTDSDQEAIEEAYNIITK